MLKLKHRYGNDISSIGNNSSLRDISVGTLDKSDISSIGNNSSLHDISSFGSLDKSNISSIGNNSSLRDISSLGSSLNNSGISSISNTSSLPDISIDKSFDYSNDDTMSDIGDAGSVHNLSDQSFDYSDDEENPNYPQNMSEISSLKSGNTTREDSSRNSSQGSLHLSDLEGGRRRKTRKTRKGKKSRKTRKTRKGKKSRKTRKCKKDKKSRKTRKMKGGALYGTGVGANNFDPNYSIYNTRELTLFPYKPN
jgi:hypothetical protein